jgi:hypothetical protein
VEDARDIQTGYPDYRKVRKALYALSYVATYFEQRFILK